MNDGKITAVVAINAPRIPFVVKPANVATFTPTGPGVIEDIASISVNCLAEYQWNLSAISYKNGNVAYPPPKEKTPTWKNCKNNWINNFIYSFSSAFSVFNFCLSSIFCQTIPQINAPIIIRASGTFLVRAIIVHTI